VDCDQCRAVDIKSYTRKTYHLVVCESNVDPSSVIWESSTGKILVFCKLHDAIAVGRTLEKGGEYQVEATERQAQFCLSLSVKDASGARVDHPVIKEHVDQDAKSFIAA